MKILLFLAFTSPAHGAPTPVMLDLGPQHGLVLPGFSEVTAWSSADPRVRWQRAPGPARDAGWPDPLLRDGYMDGEIHIDLPPGTYTVAALIDDVDFGLRPPVGTTNGVTLQGAPALMIEVPKAENFFSSRWHAHAVDARFGPDTTTFDRHVAGAAPWRFATVRIEDENGLRVEPKGYPLAALVVSPSDRATVEVEAAVIDGRRRQWMIEYRPDTGVPSLPFSADGDLVVEAIAWDEMPAPQPRAVDPSPKEAAPDQRLTWLFALHGATEGVRATLAGLEALDARLFEVRWSDVHERGITQPRPWHLVPLADGSIRADQGLVPMIAISARVPVDAPPGDVAARLRLTTAGTSVEVPLPVRIRDLRLEPPASPFGVWADLRAPVANAFGPDDPRTRQVWAHDVALLREHDVSLLNLRGAYHGAGGPSADHEARFRWATEAWRQAGGGPVTWVDAGGTHALGSADPHQPFFDPKTADMVGRWLRAAKDLDVELYIDDEHVSMLGPGRVPFLRRYLQEIQALNAEVGARVSLAEAHPGSWSTVRDLVDTNYVQAYPRIEPDWLAWWRDSRTRPVLYNVGFQRETTSVIPWAMESEGVVLWHWSEPFGDPFNSVRRVQWQMTTLAPDGQSVWSTARLERLTEGVQDQRYLTTASVLVRELHQHRSGRVRALVEETCAALRVAHRATLGHRPGQIRDVGLLSETSLEALQRELGDRAEALARWSTRQPNLRRGRAVPPASGFYPREICEPSP